MLPATVTVTIAAPCVVTDTAHGLRRGNAVVFETTGALPTGLTVGTTYYVSWTNFTANSYQVVATPGVGGINTGGTQSGTHTRIDRALPVIVTITSANPGVVSDRRHGMSNNEMVMLTTTGTLPSGLSVMTVYYVVNSTADTYQLSATRGDTAIDTSGGAGSGAHSCYRPEAQYTVTNLRTMDKYAIRLHNSLIYRRVRVSGLVTGSRVKGIDNNTEALLANVAEGGGVAEFWTQKLGNIRIEARKASGAPYYKPWITVGAMDATIGSLNVIATQISDA